jgi:hypothetical protein
VAGGRRRSVLVQREQRDSVVPAPRVLERGLSRWWRIRPRAITRVWRWILGVAITALALAARASRT